MDDETPGPTGPNPPAGLELQAREPRRARSTSNPEMQEWADKFRSGEFMAQKPEGEPSGEGEPAGAGDRSAQITASMPTVGRPQDKPAEVRPGAPVAKIAVFVAIGLVVLAIGGKLALNMVNKKKPANHAVVTETLEDDFVRRMQAEGENAPDCWTTDDGYRFAYRDRQGERVIVDLISEVPVLHRKGAVCIPE